MDTFNNIQLAISVTKGEVSFTLKMSPEMAPHVQIVAYTVLHSERMIAHRADFPTEKCFSHKVRGRTWRSGRTWKIKEISSESSGLGVVK